MALQVKVLCKEEHYNANSTTAVATKLLCPMHTPTRNTTVFIIKPTRCTNFTNLFWHETLHVSDSSSVHQEEFIHCTLCNGVCHTGL